MQFNDRFYDVVTRGEFVENGTPVRVVRCLSTPHRRSGCFHFLDPFTG